MTTKWFLRTGDFERSITRSNNADPIEVATIILEKHFKSEFKKQKKTKISFDIISFVYNVSDNTQHVMPTDIIFANAGFYDHAEMIRNVRLEKTFENDK